MKTTHIKKAGHFQLLMALQEVWAPERTPQK
jgi:hypothetical protein